MEQGNTVRLQVSPEVARIVGKEASEDLQLAAARGELPVRGRDLFTALLFLANGKNPKVRRQALATLDKIPGAEMNRIIKQTGLPSQVLDFLARLRLDDSEVLTALLAQPALTPATLARVAAAAEGPVLSLATRHPLAGSPEVAGVLAGRRHCLTQEGTAAEEEKPAEQCPPAAGAAGETAPEDEMEEDLDPSKYKQALQMDVAEKIKMALTGDKEWRSIFLRDTNKLVSSAVLKNPRITEGEVLGVANNKSSHDELIRIILLNRDWVKNYEIQKTLVLHPKTPLPKALRFMNNLTLKDLKGMAKSRNISQVIVNNARRMMLAKEKKR